MATWSRSYLAALISITLLIVLDMARMFMAGIIPSAPIWFLAQSILLAFAVAGLLSVFAILFQFVHRVVLRAVAWASGRLRGQPVTARVTDWISLGTWVLLWVLLASSYLRRIGEDVQMRPGFLRLDWFTAVAPGIPILLVTGFAIFAGFIGLTILFRADKENPRGDIITGATLLIALILLYLDGFFLVGYYHLYHHILGLLILVLLGIVGSRALTWYADRYKRDWLRRRRVFLGLLSISVVSVAMVFAGLLFRSSSHMDTILFDTSYIRRVAIEFREATDTDSDGFSRILGGGDTDDGNPGIHPLASDTPGDGIDQDGDGQDLTPVASQRIANRLRRAYGAYSETSPRVDRVLFITVDSFRQDRIGALASDMRPACPCPSAALPAPPCDFRTHIRLRQRLLEHFGSVLTTSMFEPDSSQIHP